MTLLRFTPPLFETRAQASGVVEGYGATFGGIDTYGHTIKPGAFADSVRGGMPLMLWQHRQDMPIGRWVEAQEDGRGLFVRGQLNLQTTAGREAFEHLRAGDINGLSIGYRIPPGGDRRQGDVQILTKIDLVEISPVSLPSDAGARVTAVKSERPKTMRELQRALQDHGYSRRQAAAICERGFGGLEGAGEDDEEPHIDALLAKLRAVNF